MIFISNIAIVANYSFAASSYGDGPLRVIYTNDGRMKVVVVDGSGIKATLFDIEESAVSNGQEETAIYKVKDYRV